MTESTQQEDHAPVTNPEAKAPVRETKRESVDEDILDLRENLQRSPKLTRHINLLVFGGYIMALLMTVLGGWLVWHWAHHY